MALQKNQKPTPKFSAAEMKKVLQRLWADHVIYTRLYIVSYLSGLADADAILNRLMQNQVDIGNVLAKFYGKPVGDAVASLLQQHIAIAGDLLKAIKEGNQSRIDYENKRWLANANSISVMLSQINPYWKQSDMLQELTTHLRLTTQEITAFVTKDYVGSVNAFDAALKHANHLAEVFGMGIYANHQNLF